MSSNKNLADKHLIATLRLIRSDNVGPKTFYNFIRYYGNPETAIEHLPEFIKRSKSNITIASEEAVLKEIEHLQKEGAWLVSYQDEAYSALLKNIDSAPPILSYKGDLSLLNRKSVAIVGARNCSIPAKQFASKLASELSGSSVTITSGLARGIDAAAHEASKPNTIAIIAGGIDNIYPPENHRLYKEIGEKGLLIAELPIGSVPLARHFPQRNRIISGLSLATIVIEAGLSSGSLITAQYALEQNREVFACPGFPLDPRCKGSNKLIKDGAQLLEGSEDVLNYINSSSFEMNSAMQEDSGAGSYEIKTIPTFQSVSEKMLNDQNRQKILDLLSASPVLLEDIAEQTSLPYPVILTILLEFELQGKVNSIGKNRYFLSFS